MVNPQADAGRVGVGATTTAKEFGGTKAGDQHQPPSENDWTSTAERRYRRLIPATSHGMVLISEYPKETGRAM